MLTKSCLVILASVAVANGAVKHRHLHNKKAMVYIETDTVTETTWTTVTVDPEQEAPTAPASSTSVLAVTTPSTTAIPVTTPTTTPPTSAAQTTLSTSVKAPDVPQVNVVESSSSTTATLVEPSTTAVPTTSTTAAAAAVAAPAATNKRGAAYNTASLITPLLGANSKISWAYNWGQVSDGLSDVSSSIEWVPMLWGTRTDFTSVWATNAEKAIADGAKNFLIFNEPDNASQSNMDPATAAAAHIQYANPYSGRVRIGTAAITNSNNAGEGVQWLEAFASACAGNCKYDFCAAHWYSPADTADFLSFTQKVQAACGDNKPVWITEFAPTGDDATVVSFLTEVQDQLDNNVTFSFVERYAYFMVSDGVLVSGSSASTIGNAFAFGA